MSLGPEDRLHTWLRQRLRRAGFDRLGDDGAILRASGPWAVTQDHQIEDVHFTAGLDPRMVARRLLAVNLSDLAAMGAQPAFAFLALSFPPGFDARRFLDSFIAAGERFGVELAGGDLARNDKVTTALTLLGTLPQQGAWLTRSNARPGDRLWLAGPVGLSALGRSLLESGARVGTRSIDLSAIGGLTRREERLGKKAVRCHLTPDPQLEVGWWLGSRHRAAAIDISDGLAIDLRRLCRESQVGALIQVESLPIQKEFTSLCRKLGQLELDLVLGGGEDYALLFSVPASEIPPPNLRCTPIGSLTAEPGLLMSLGEQIRPLPEAGWDHFAAPSSRAR